ncbi:hypothetical protein [Catellatospora sp. NPDC049133]|uniref:WD40 repeat domain-containing protein n=1 Tax=Catellatospora sp. NPDC049133 TaxID=3155499 RepID=UPI0033C43F9E
MDEVADPRAEFAARLQSLRTAAGLSIRQLEIESARTPRRRGEQPIRLKRSTIADMIGQTRPVRPEPANFEVFVDTCLRVSADRRRALPDGLGDRRAWDEAYRNLRDYTDRHRRPPGIPPPAGAPDGLERQGTPAHAEQTAVPVPLQPAALGGSSPVPRPFLSRRQILLATPLVLAGAATPFLLRRGPASTAGPEPGSATGPAAHSSPGYRGAGTLISPPTSADNPVWSVAVDHLNGEPVAVVGRADGTVQFWNPITGTARSRPLAGHDKPVYSIALAGPIAVSAGVDGALRLWDLTGDPPTSGIIGERLSAGINSVALGQVEGRIVAVSASDDRTIRTWHTATPRAPSHVLGTRLDAAVTSVAAGVSGGTTIAVSGSADGAIWLWNVQTRQPVGRLGAHRAAVWALATATVGGKAFAVSGSEDGEIRVWDLSPPAPSSRTIADVNVAVKSIATAAVDGTTVAICGSDDAAVRILDVVTGRPYGSGLGGPSTAAVSMAATVIGGRAFVISGHWDGTIWTWHL